MGKNNRKRNKDGLQRDKLFQTSFCNALGKVEKRKKIYICKRKTIQNPSKESTRMTSLYKKKSLTSGLTSEKSKKIYECFV